MVCLNGNFNSFSNSFLISTILKGNLNFLFKDLFTNFFETHHTAIKQRVTYAPENFDQLTFDEILNSVSALRKSTTDENLNAEYAKLPGMVLRIAGVLTVLENV